jgi:hypothetical protein
MQDFFKIFLLLPFLGISQSSFQMPEGERKLTIPFELVSNMILVKAEVNGVVLDFALDSGASSTSILNLAGVDSLNVGQGNRVQISGYGRRKPTPAIYSQFNKIKVGDYFTDQGNIYVLTEDQISLVGLIGREVNGVLGADFFTNHPVAIDYRKNKITVYRDIEEAPRYLRSNRIALNLESNKPHATMQVSGKELEKKLNILLDTGNGDSLWIFGNRKDFSTSKKSFDSYLGLGVSGEVFGTRTKIKSLVIAGHQFSNVTTAFPEKDFLDNSLQFNGSTGSIGNEILRRFDLLFDYPNQQLFLHPNSYYDDGFFYNMLGIQIKEGEKDLITSVKSVEAKEKTEVRSMQTLSTTDATIVTYSLQPKIIVTAVVKNSLAARYGIKKGDEIIRLNNKNKGEFSMNDIFNYMYNKPYSTLRLRLKRGDQIIEKKFKLLPIID